ncbi:MAG: 16S rRNA-processing protein RimM, 16S rRNA processing protein RimM [Deltaproteobacteria bacterium CSP1-8]|nr:MAG: 16S rRNA-processing protein RimM, 16S rRNA processing protein RimM [Deltaproteobacteria bacterium CSP1-8]
MTERRIEVGRVAGPHGVAGQIRVKPYSKNPSGLLAVRTVRLSAKGGGETKRVGDFEVKTAKPQGGFAVFMLGGIDTPEEAKEWSGALVSVLREDLPPTEEGEYYVMDLIGCEVVDAAGVRVGELVGVEEGPAHDWLAIRREDGETLLPMVSEFIREVDVAGRRIVVAPPEGW